MERIRSSKLLLVLALLARVTVSAQNDAIEALDAARDALRSAPVHGAPLEAVEAAAPPESGWPEIAPYERSHRAVAALNAQLAANRVKARLYHVNLAKTAAPPTLAQTHLIVFQDGKYALAPFYDPGGRGFSQIISVQLVGSSLLATRNEHGIVLVDLNAGIVNRELDLAGIYDAKTGRFQGSHRASTVHLLRAAGFAQSSIDVIVPRVLKVRGGLKAGELPGLTVDLRPGVRALIHGVAAAGVPDERKLLYMELEGAATIQLWPNFRLPQ